MGVTMSRRPGGGSSKNAKCVFGESGERGMGKQYSGGSNKSKTMVWDNPSRQKGKDHAKVVPNRRQPENYYKLSRNPSGASNMPVRPSPMLDMRDREV